MFQCVMMNGTVMMCYGLWLYEEVYMPGWEQLAWLNGLFMHADSCVYMPQIVAVGS